MLKKVNRHITSKNVTQLLKKKIGERANITKTDLDKALGPNALLLSDMKKLTKLRGVKNSSKLTKEDLFIHS